MERSIDLIKTELKKVDESILELESYIKRYEEYLVDYREKLSVALEKKEEFEKAIDILTMVNYD